MAPITIFDAKKSTKIEKGDINTENFVPFVNDLLVKEGKDGVGFIILKAPFLVDEIDSDSIRSSECTSVKITDWENFKDFSIIKSSKEWVKKGTNTICTQKKEKHVPKYLGKPYMNYLGSGRCKKYPDAENGMNDQEIVTMAINFYEEEAKTHVNEYSVIEHSLMKNCSLDIEKIENRLTKCGSLTGVNSGYTFFGRRGSQSQIHPEDYMLPSINFCLKGIKVWTILNYDESRKLDRIFQESFKGENFVFSDCPFKSSHKSFAITPAFLDFHKIKYTFFVQREGDIVVTNVGCSHMVVNLAPSIAFAINVFLPSVINYDEPTLCNCKDRKGERIEITEYKLMREAELLNEKMRVQEKEFRKIVHELQSVNGMMREEIEKMKQKLQEKGEYDRGEEGREPTDLKKKIYGCEKCGLYFSSSSNLSRHKHIHDINNPSLCYICGEKFSRKDSLQRHLKKH